MENIDMLRLPTIEENTVLLKRSSIMAIVVNNTIKGTNMDDSHPGRHYTTVYIPGKYFIVPLSVKDVENEWRQITSKYVVKTESNNQISSSV